MSNNSKTLPSTRNPASLNIQLCWRNESQLHDFPWKRRDVGNYAEIVATLMMPVS